MTLTVLWTCAVLCALANPVWAQVASDSLYRAARGEGEIMFGGAIKETAAEEISKAFAKRYPGIRVSYTRRPTEDMVKSVEADRKAGKVKFDLINVTEPADLLRWKAQGFLARVPLPEIVGNMRPETFDADGFFYALGITPMYGVYNTQMLDAGSAPKSLKELVTDPKWVGKIVISRPIRGGTSASALLNVVNAAGRDVIARASSLEVLLTRGNEAALAAVASGERPVSWGVSGYRVLDAKQDGEPVELIYWEEGLALAYFIGCVPGRAPHPNSARLLLEWLLSVEGQMILVATGNFYSSRKDLVATPAGQPPLDQLKISNFSMEQVVNEAQRLAVEFDRALGLQ
jgi:iron(III) transport system substrate-binding protein